MLDTSVNPYYDDYDAVKNYIRVLYKPGAAVQARELTQMQTALQHQITKFGDHIFKDGSVVIPGGLSLNISYDYVKLAAGNESDYINFTGTTVTGTSGIQAKVLETIGSEGSDPVTLYVKYIKTGTDNITTAFADGETLDNGQGFECVVATDGTGKGSSVNIQEGIYFVSGAFVVVADQSIILDKYTSSPSYSIGLHVTESIVTSVQDATLNDNSVGTPNYAAPGAHRYAIDLTLIKQDINLYAPVDTGDIDNNTVANFIQLMKIDNGQVRSKADKPLYNELEKTLARRTFDESGNYTVRPFIMNMKQMSDVTPAFTKNGDPASSFLAAGLEPSKAYVQGYEIESHEIKYIPIRKARSATDVAYHQNAVINATLGNYIVVDSMSGFPDIENFSEINMIRSNLSVIGTCRARSIEYTGTPGKYKLYLFDIKFTNGTLNDLFGFVSTTFTFSANIVSGAEFLETSENTLVYKLPFDTIKDMKDSGGLSDTTYTVKKTYTIQLDGSGVGTLSISGSDVFDEVNATDWVAFIDSAGNGTYSTITPLTVGTGENQATIASGNLTATVYLNATYAGKIIKVVARTFRTAQPGTKIKQNATIQIQTPGTNAGNITSLAEADGLKLTGIWMSQNFSTDATEADVIVSENFIFDNGQRENFYGPCRIQHKIGTPTPTGRLLVKYEYLSHVGGDYFSVDSYPVDVAYDDIPEFASKNGTISLRDALDFRPRKSDGGANFTGSNSATFDLPKPDTLVVFDLHFYMGRVDKVYVDSKGTFGVTEGVSSLNPKMPADPKDAMTLYTVVVNPYTFSTSDVVLKMHDNKRYTMRDIGSLEGRIKNLEYYTTLSLLEKAAANREIIDDAGFSRFKNGFLVDAFKGHNVANVYSQDHKCAIDKQRGELRSMGYSNNIKMMFNSGGSTGVVRTGPLVTLPYTNAAYIEQKFSSESINVNPYNVFAWNGNIELSPESDQWKDTEVAPDVLVNQDGLYDTMVAALDEAGVTGTMWNEWETNWSGTEVDTSKTSKHNGEGFLRGGKTYTTTITSTTTTDLSRSGVETTVSPDTITTNVGNRIAEVNYIPFIRSRTVKFRATRLKPNTRVYAYFDGVDVSEYCATATWVDDDFVVNTSSNDILFNRITKPFPSTALISDANGTVQGKFYLPNTPTMRFKTGKRIFRLLDNLDKSLKSTEAETEYFAEGLLQTVENVSIATRVPKIERSELGESKTTTSIDTNVTQKKDAISYIDPIAQTFLVDNPEGVFITDIDLYFVTKDSNVPVTVQLRTTLNGVPTTTVVPFGQVTKNPSAVAVSDNASAATNFQFSSPVYLQAGVEYSFVVLSNSDEYNMFVAKVGGDDKTTNKRITKQPYNGVLFKSQNGSTWTPDQTLDVKFVLNRAVFTTNTAGYASFKNDTLPKRYLKTNPISITSGSAIIKINHPNHNMYPNSSVTISGAAATANQSPSTLLGIPVGLINANHTIISVEHDSYKVDIGTGNEATATGVSGNTAVIVTENYQYNTLYPAIQELLFPDTDMIWSVKTYSGKSIAGSETPKITDGLYYSMISNLSLIHI